MPKIFAPSLIDIPSVSTEHEGTLGIVECERALPFDVKRIFFAHDMPRNTVRGQHANLTLQEFLICLSGTTVIDSKSPAESSVFELSTRTKGLLIPPMNWINLTAKVENTSWVVLASEPYNAEDQLRDFEAYWELASRPDQAL